MLTGTFSLTHSNDIEGVEPWGLEALQVVQFPNFHQRVGQNKTWMDFLLQEKFEQKCFLISFHFFSAFYVEERLRYSCVFCLGKRIVEKLVAMRWKFIFSHDGLQRMNKSCTSVLNVCLEMMLFAHGVIWSRINWKSWAEGRDVHLTSYG